MADELIQEHREHLDPIDLLETLPSVSEGNLSDVGSMKRFRRRLELLKKHGITSRYSGEKAFKLYDTFGLPLDFMVDAARDQGIEFDQAGFDLAMDEQRERARASWKGGAGKATASSGVCHASGDGF